MAQTLTVSSDCQMIGIDPDLEKELCEHLTIENPQYLAAKKYGRWIGKNLKPQLKYYEIRAGGLSFPRGFANRAVLCFRAFYGRDPDIIDNRRLLEEVSFDFQGTLRPYQAEALAAADRKSFGVIEAGTGSGKTVMALALIARRRQPSLILVHTKELFYQWQERIEQFLNCSPGLVGDGKFILQPVTVAIVNSAKKRVEELCRHFGHLVVDECHRVPATLFTDVVSRFDTYYMLGLSATAFRKDEEMTKLIYYFLGDRIHRVDQGQLMHSGAVLSPGLIQRTTSFRKVYRGDYQALIKALVSHEGRNGQIVNEIAGYVQKEQRGTALVVSDRVAHCRFLAEKLQKRGLRVALLHGRLAPEERNEVVAAVQNCKVQVLVATLQLISEGFDCPGLSSLFLTTPIRFEGRLLQVIGRIMRPAEKKQPLVFDFVDEHVPTLLRSARERAAILAKL